MSMKIDTMRMVPKHPARQETHYGNHNPVTHYSSKTGACMCIEKCCIGDGGCKCRGCSGVGHMGCKNASVIIVRRRKEAVNAK